MNVGSATRRYLPVGVTARRKLRRFYSNDGRKSSACRARKGRRKRGGGKENDDDDGNERGEKETKKGKETSRARYVRDKSFSLRDI